MGRSTRQVAKLVGVHWQTLHAWIRDGKVKAPKVQTVGGLSVRNWTDRGVARLRREIKNLYHPEMVRTQKKAPKKAKRRPKERG